MDKFKWIRDYTPTSPENCSNRISNLIPYIFDHYFLVHWKVGIIDTFPFEEYPDLNETIEATNKRINIEREFGLFLNPDKDKLFRETNLREISKLFKTPYNFNVLKKIKETPGIQILEEPSIVALQSGLQKIVNRELLNFFIADVNRFVDDGRQEYEGIAVEKYIELQKDLFYDYCTYLFPDDVSWCLSTSEDFPMFLCTKKEVSENFINDFPLELFKIEYEEELF